MSHSVTFPHERARLDLFIDTQITVVSHELREIRPDQVFMTITCFHIKNLLTFISPPLEQMEHSELFQMNDLVEICRYPVLPVPYLPV